MTSRRAVPQQGGTYIDFDVVTPSPEGSEARAAERRQAADDITAALQSGNQLAAVNPQGQEVILTHQTDDATAVPLPSPNDDDDSVRWWVILLIVAGCLIFLAVIIIIVVCCCCRRDRGEENRGRALYSSPAEKTTPMYLPTDQYPGDAHPSDAWKESPYQHPPYQSGSEPNRSGELLQPRSLGPSSSPTDLGSYTADETGRESELGVFEPGDRVTAQYIDGEWYTGTVWSFTPADAANPNGTYTIKWDDSSISDGIPPQQMKLFEEEP